MKKLFAFLMCLFLCVSVALAAEPSAGEMRLRGVVPMPQADKNKNKSDTKTEDENKDTNQDPIDLSDMTYNELVALKDQINLAIWANKKWQKVTVPQGVWLVGADIPIGKWTITCEGNYGRVTIGTALNQLGTDIDIAKTEFYYVDTVYSPSYRYFEEGSDKTEITVTLKFDTYVVVDQGDVVFSPYSGKPGLGFK